MADIVIDPADTVPDHGQLVLKPVFNDAGEEVAAKFSERHQRRLRDN